MRRELDETLRQVKQVLVMPNKCFIEKQMTELEEKINGLCSSNKDLIELLDKVDFDAIF